MSKISKEKRKKRNNPQIFIEPRHGIADGPRAFYIVLFSMFFGVGIIFTTIWLLIPTSEWWDMPSSRLLILPWQLIIAAFPPIIVSTIGLIIGLRVSSSREVLSSFGILSVTNGVIFSLAVFVDPTPLVAQYNACFSESQMGIASVSYKIRYCSIRGRRPSPCGQQVSVIPQESLGIVGSYSLTNDSSHRFRMLLKLDEQSASFEFRTGKFGTSIISINGVGIGPSCWLPHRLFQQ